MSLNEYYTMELFQGIVIGASSGLTLSLIFWHSDPRYETVGRDIGRFRIFDNSFLRDERGYIQPSSATIKETGPHHIHIPVETVRFESYREMHKDLFSALQGRTSSLKYDEIYSVKKAFQLIDAFLDQEQGIHFHLYEKAFDELEKCSWLKLPAGQTGDSEESARA